jgi:hypothetical protein
VAYFIAAISTSVPSVAIVQLAFGNLAAAGRERGSLGIQFRDIMLRASAYKC